MEREVDNPVHRRRRCPATSLRVGGVSTGSVGRTDHESSSSGSVRTGRNVQRTLRRHTSVESNKDHETEKDPELRARLAQGTDLQIPIREVRLQSWV